MTFPIYYTNDYKTKYFLFINRDIVTLITEAGAEIEIERKVDAAGMMEGDLINGTPIKTTIEITHGTATKIEYITY